jgi:hypothetical protein
VARTAQGLKDKVLRKKFVLSIESWFSTFFSLFFWVMVMYDVTFKFYEDHSETTIRVVWSMDKDGRFKSIFV